MQPKDDKESCVRLAPPLLAANTITPGSSGKVSRAPCMAAPKVRGRHGAGKTRCRLARRSWMPRLAPDQSRAAKVASGPSLQTPCGTKRQPIWCEPVQTISTAT